MFIAGGNNVNSCGVDTAVAENIGEFCDILFNAVKYSREEMAQVVRKYFLWIYPRLLAQRFHFTPNIGAAYWLACSCNKNTS